MMHPIRLTAVILGLAAATGCASSKTAAQAGASHRSTGDVLGGEELSGTGATNVYDAVQRLRPQWLTSARIRRGGSGDELVVYLDSNRYGTLTSLRSLSRRRYTVERDTPGIPQVLDGNHVEVAGRAGELAFSYRRPGLAVACSRGVRRLISLPHRPPRQLSI